jgi:hypothetical protein
MTTARILGSGRQRRTVELVPEPLVASYLVRDSAGCIIVTTGLPDPKRIVLKPQPELHPLYICGTQPRLLPKRIWAAEEHPSFNFSVLIQTFATGARIIVGADDILAKYRPTQNQRLATSPRIRILGNPLRFAKGNRLIRLGEYCSQLRPFAEWEWRQSKWLW